MTQHSNKGGAWGKEGKREEGREGGTLPFRHYQPSKNWKEGPRFFLGHSSYLSPPPPPSVVARKVAEERKKLWNGTPFLVEWRNVCHTVHKSCHNFLEATGRYFRLLYFRVPPPPFSFRNGGNKWMLHANGRTGRKEETHLFWLARQWAPSSLASIRQTDMVERWRETEDTKRYSCNLEDRKKRLWCMLATLSPPDLISLLWLPAIHLNFWFSFFLPREWQLCV